LPKLGENVRIYKLGRFFGPGSAEYTIISSFLGGKVVKKLGLLSFALVLLLSNCADGPSDNPPGLVDLAVTNVDASVDGAGQITLTWQEQGTLGHLEISWTPGGETVQTVEPGVRTYAISGLAYETAYDVTINAIDGDGAISSTAVFWLVTAPEGAVFVSDVAGLQAVNSGLDGYYVLTRDLDLTGQSFSPIGSMGASFEGTFDGYGHAISHLYLSLTGTGVGLFASNTGLIRNLRVLDANINGENSVGALAGLNYGTIAYCSSSGSVNATDNYVGGLVGGCMGLVENSFSTCSVHTSSQEAGGLAGTATTADFVNCYATGAVSADVAIAGGLVGRYWSGTIQNCYALGITSAGEYPGGLIGWLMGGTIAGSYYNEANSVVGPGTPKALSDLRTASTFVDWDFAGTWAISAGINGGYPYLLGPEY